jgi:disulfide bond formation protein DsbB
VIILSLIANIFIAFYHSGVEKKIFREYSGCSVKTNAIFENITQLREVLQSNKLAKCDDPQLFIFGLTMAQWNFIYCLFLLIIIVFSYFKLIYKNNSYS